MNTLPREIFGNIVSRLKLGDWITCVNVCRAWRIMTPIEVRKLLNKVAIDHDTLHYLDSIRLFPSIRTVVLRGNKIVGRAPMLSPCQITALELVHISMSDEHLITSLRPFSKHLKSLIIKTRSRPSISFAKILRTFPNLVHFGFFFAKDRRNARDTFLGSSMARNSDDSFRLTRAGEEESDNEGSEEDDMRQLRFDPLSEDHNLMSLEFSQCVIQDSLLAILRRLPRLEVLRFDADYLFLDPIHILHACPRLKLLHEGPQPFPFQQQLLRAERDQLTAATATASAAPDNHDSLLYFSMRLVTTHLFEIINPDHLRVLHLPNIHQLPSSAAAAAISFPQLHTLSCQDVSSDSHLLTDLLNRCPNLEFLYLHECSRHRSLPRLSKPLADAIARLPRIRGLHIQSNAWQEPHAAELMRRLEHKLTHLCLRLPEIGSIMDAVLRMRALQELRLETLHRWTLDGSGSPSIRLGLLKSLRRFQLNMEGGASLTRKEVLDMRHLEAIHLTGSHTPSLADLETLITVAPRLKTLSIVTDTTSLAQAKHHLLNQGARLGITISMASTCTYHQIDDQQPFCS